MRMNDKKRNIGIAQQFLYSFLAVLVLPIIVFTACFFYYNQNVYREKIVERVDQSITSSVQVLDGHLNNLYMTTQYHSTRLYMQDHYVAKDIIGTEIPSVLGGETATNSFLEGICYYNSQRPQRMYTETGTYQLDYYVHNYLDMDRQVFFEKMSSIKKRGWLSVQKTKEDGSKEIVRLYHIIRGKGEAAWWMFKISPDSLRQIILEYDTEVVLLDIEGNMIYESPPNNETKQQSDEAITLEMESTSGIFILKKSIYNDQLYGEMLFWQTVLVVVFVSVLCLGVFVVVRITNYQIRPIYELRDYCAGKSMRIPDNTKGFNAYLYVVKDLDMQIEMLNELKRKERLLLQMLWDSNGSVEELQENLNQAGLYINVKYYRVIVATFSDQSSRSKLDSYSAMKTLEDYEIHAVETMDDNTSILVVGMQDVLCTDLERALEMLANANTAKNGIIRFFVGEPVDSIGKVRLSYRQALLCGKNSSDRRESCVVYYESPIAVETPENDTHLVEKVCAYIEENITLYDLNVSFVANHFNVSISNLSHQFKRQMNQTILEYINTRKFSYAAKLLRETDYSVLMISTMLGYSQAASFIRKFGKIYGMTPNNYRNTHAKENPAVENSATDA